MDFELGMLVIFIVELVEFAVALIVVLVVVGSVCNSLLLFELIV